MTPKLKTCDSCPAQFPVLEFTIGGRTFSSSFTKCDACAAKQVKAEQLKAEAEMQALRQAQWNRICPVAFHSTDPSRIAPAKLSQVLDWKFGPLGLLLYGSTGKCKTRSTYLLLQREFMAGRSVTALTGGQLSRECSAVFSDSSTAALKWFNQLATVDILFIDDIGHARITDRVASELFDLVDDRTRNGRPIIATINQTGAEFADKFDASLGAPLERRLREFCKIIQF